MPPAWWARSLYHYNATAVEPIGVVLAMQSTQDGQMPGLIGEVLLPAFERHYGFKRSAPEIEFFAEHDAADVEHSRRQSDLCGKYLDTPELETRALQVAERLGDDEACLVRDLHQNGDVRMLFPELVDECRIEERA